VLKKNIDQFDSQASTLKLALAAFSAKCSEILALI
jgi:hypothetical protein